MEKATVTIDLKPLRQFAEAVDRDLRMAGNGPVRRALRQWAARYRGFLQRRFDRHSKGGGDWPALALSTVRRRRKGKPGRQTARSSLARDTRRAGRLVSAGGAFSILRDIGLLYQALTPTFERRPGQLQEDVPFGVRVGYGGPAAHGDDKVTVAQIARWHQEGAGHLPKREIVVPPDRDTVDRMRSDMERAIAQLAERANA